MSRSVCLRTLDDTKTNHHENGFHTLQIPFCFTKCFKLGGGHASANGRTQKGSPRRRAAFLFFGIYKALYMSVFCTCTTKAKGFIMSVTMVVRLIWCKDHNGWLKDCKGMHTFAAPKHIDKKPVKKPNTMELARV